MFFLPFLALWWGWRLFELPAEQYVDVAGIVIIATVLVGGFWLVADWKALSKQTLFFLGCLTVIFAFFGPDLEFPQDNWGYWDRTVRFPAENRLTGLGESINGAAANLFPESWWYGDVWWSSTVWAALVCLAFYRFACAVGLNGMWARFSVVTVLFFMGTLGMPMVRHVILGEAAMGMIAQLTIFTVAIRLVKNRGWSGIWTFIPLMLIAHANHLQNLIMAILGLVAIGIWWTIDRFGWRKGGVAMAVLAIVFWGVFQFFLFRGGLQRTVEGLIAEGVWMREPGVFNLFGAEGRVLLPLGIVGLLNLGIAVFLVVKNRLLGWLTLMPVLALCYPPFAEIYGYALERYADLIVFNRILLLVPNTFAIVLGFQYWSTSLRSQINSGEARPRWMVGLPKILPIVMVLLLSIIAVIPRKPFYGKLANWVNPVPYGHRLEPLHELNEWVREYKSLPPATLILADVATSFALSTELHTKQAKNRRWFPGRVSDLVPEIMEEEADVSALLKDFQAVVLVRDPLPVTSSPSLMSTIFGHSPPLLIKYDLTYSPQLIRKMDALVESGEWTREEAPPFYYWYEPVKQIY